MRKLAASSHLASVRSNAMRRLGWQRLQERAQPAAIQNTININNQGLQRVSSASVQQRQRGQQSPGQANTPQSPSQTRRRQRDIQQAQSRISRDARVANERLHQAREIREQAERTVFQHKQRIANQAAEIRILHGLRGELQTYTAELEGQMKKLDFYRRLSFGRKIKLKELSAGIKNLAVLKNQLKTKSVSLEEMIKHQTAQIESLQQNLTTAQSENARLTGLVRVASDAVAAHQGLLNETRQQIEQLAQAHARLIQEERSLRGQTSTSLTDLQRRYGELEDRRKTLELQLQELNQAREHEKSEIENLRQKAEVLESEKNAANATVERLNAHLRQRNEDMSTLETQLEQTKTAVTNLSQTEQTLNARLADETGRSQEQIQKLEKERNELQKKLDHANKKRALNFSQWKKAVERERLMKKGIGVSQPLQEIAQGPQPPEIQAEYPKSTEALTLWKGNFPEAELAKQTAQTLINSRRNPQTVIELLTANIIAASTITGPESEHLAPSLNRAIGEYLREGNVDTFSSLIAGLEANYTLLQATASKGKMPATAPKLAKKIEIAHRFLKILKKSR